MSDKTITVESSVAKTDSRQDEVSLTVGSDAWDFVSGPTPRYVPLFSPRGQVFYWTRHWQDGEDEADEEFRRGEARTFDNTADALRWLDDPED